MDKTYSRNVSEAWNVVRYLNKAWVAKGLTFDEYKEALANLEKITGIHFA